MTSSSSAGVPSADPNGTAVVAIERVDELDEETALQLVRSMRPVGVTIAISGVAPIGLGLVLLQMAANSGVEVPTIVLAAGLAVALAAPFAILLSQRRAFLNECRSLGISTTLAKKLYWRFIRGEVRIEPPRFVVTRDEMERTVVRRLLKP